MPLKAILWDMDGTLIDSEPVHSLAFDDAIAALGFVLPPNTHDSLLGSSMVEVHQTVVELTGATLTLEAWRATKWKYYQQYAAAIKPLPGIPELVQQLLARDIPMAVVSNSIREEVDLNLSVTGFNHYFPLTISRNDVTHGKPAPDCYLAAAQRLGVAVEDCLVVEDSVTGAKAGLAAGMTTVFHPETTKLVADCPEGAVLLPPDGDLVGLVGRYLGL